MPKSFSVNVDLSGALAELDDIQESMLGAVRPAAQAGAQVLYDQVLANLAAIDAKIYTGNLKDSIYQVYSKEHSNETTATYHISWNLKTGTQNTPAPHAGWIEYGYIDTFKHYKKDGKWYSALPPNYVKGMAGTRAEPRQVKARPFVRPAFDAKRFAALEAVEARWLDEFNKTR